MSFYSFHNIYTDQSDPYTSFLDKSISSPNQTRWSFDDLNSEKQHLDSIALKLISSYIPEYGYPSPSLNIQLPKEPSISHPHRIIDLDIFKKTENSTKTKTRFNKKKGIMNYEEVIFSDDYSSDPLFDFNDVESNQNQTQKIHRVNRKNAKRAISMLEETNYQKNIAKSKVFDDESDDLDSFVDSIQTFTKWNY